MLHTLQADDIEVTLWRRSLGPRRLRAVADQFEAYLGCGRLEAGCLELRCRPNAAQTACRGPRCSPRRPWRTGSSCLRAGPRPPGSSPPCPEPSGFGRPSEALKGPAHGVDPALTRARYRSGTTSAWRRQATRRAASVGTREVRAALAEAFPRGVADSVFRSRGARHLGISASRHLGQAAFASVGAPARLGLRNSVGRSSLSPPTMIVPRSIFVDGILAAKVSFSGRAPRVAIC